MTDPYFIHLRNVLRYDPGLYKSPTKSILIPMTDKNTLQKLSEEIISAIHWLPYEEAVKKELVPWCVVKYRWNAKVEVVEKYYNQVSIYHGCNYKWVDKNDLNRILWLPIDLSRVMRALEMLIIDEQKKYTRYSFLDWRIYESGHSLALRGWFIDDEDNWIYWKLLREDGSTATLEDQTEETLLSLLTLFENA